MSLVQTSYNKEDVEILLQDVKGKVPVLDTADREQLIQSGVHYSEMLPLEYKPTDEYMSIYNNALDTLSYETAVAVASMSEKVYKEKGNRVVLVSLVRAGTPVGVLARRYLNFKYNINVKHYSISIVRGKGFDVNAMEHIRKELQGEMDRVQFIDGWVGKGAITRELREAVDELQEVHRDFTKLSSSLAVLSDPAGFAEITGTTQDFLIPSACLNSTVSGLVSRSVEKAGVTDGGFHGAVFYDNLVSEDKSMEFIDSVVRHFDYIVNVGVAKASDCFIENEKIDNHVLLSELQEIMNTYGITDINKVKPGVGEATRVLLRRMPYKVLISEQANKKYLQHIIRLCEEKGVDIEVYPLKNYSVVGLIKKVTDA